jgi:DHA1 family multidrug resistance protein-like MFS transporter
MLELLERTYLSVFRRYPMLARLALVVLLGEIVVASINNFGIAFYINGDLGQPMRTVGVLVSTFLIAEMLLKLPAGHLSDRYGRRHFASVGIAASVSTAIALVAFPSALLIATPALIFLALLPLRVLDGAGAAALWPPLFASVSDHVPSEERGVAMSVINTAYLGGLALGPAFAGTAMKLARLSGHADAAGKAPFAMAVLFALIGALVAWRLPARGRAAREAAPRRGMGLPPLRTALIVIRITFCNMFATATLAPYIAPYVSRVGHVHRSNVGFLLLALMVPTAGFGMPLGHLADRWPKCRVVQCSLCVAAAGMWTVPFARTLPEMIAAGIVVTLGFMLGLPSWLALIADMAPEGASGKVMGLMATAQGLGAFLGPVLGGILWDRDIRAPFYVSAGLLTFSALAALVLLSRLRAGAVRPAAESPVGSPLDGSPVG